jgi:TonB-linked SusC/RagA family outer membrane protein
MTRTRRLVAIALAAAIVPASLAAQEAATVSGRVTNPQGDPLASVLVGIEQLGVRVTTGADGTYRLSIPGNRITAGQSAVLAATRTGLAPVSRTLTLNPGASLTVNLQMTEQAVVLPDLVVTGTIGAVEARRVPFSVGTVNAADIQAPPMTAAGALQGQLAGVTVVTGSGRPGAEPSILIRGPKSINAAGRSQEPLYIVDGVILGGGGNQFSHAGTGMADIDALDIERVEVLRGAAATSLYGSRAANGVVNITTRRGGRGADNQVRYTLRSEFGRSQLPQTPEALLTRTHQFALDEDGNFVDNQGRSCEWLECGTLRLAGQRAPSPQQANPFNTFQTQQWPGETYDQVAQLFNPGGFNQNYLAATGRAGATNFHVSLSNSLDRGVLLNQKGQERTNFRLNLDQAIRRNLSVSASAFYSSGSEVPFVESNGNPIFDLTRMPAGINLFACEDDLTQDCRDQPHRLILQPHPANTESDNPVYSLLVHERNRDRSRILGSGTFRYSPLRWFDLDGSASIDRLDLFEEDFRPKGFRTSTPSTTLNNGTLYNWNRMVQAFNASATGTFRFDLGDRVQNRTQFRYLYEASEIEDLFVSGHTFLVDGLRTIAALDRSSLQSASPREPERAEGYFAMTNFDIADRYVLDLLVRNDGSSLFGPDQRRHTYYRVAGRWLLSDEPWFRMPGVGDVGLRYSVGTAGNRPRWNAQYETFNVTSTGATFGDLGNRNLRPERTLEHEAGIDMGFLDDRARVALTHARTRTTDQLLQSPLPAPAGYQQVWVNAGTLDSRSWEASLDMRLIELDNFGWSARVNYDRNRTHITAMDVPEYRYGIPGQNLGVVFYARPGERLGTFYGLQFATQCEHLPAGVDCGQFRTNDDGLLVWTGGADHTAGRWGELAPNSIQGAHPAYAGLRWGHPVAGFCTDRSSGEQTDYCPLGQTLPDYNLSFSSTVNWGGLSVSGLVDAVQGFSVYNQPLQWAVFRTTAGIMDQSDKPEELQKPLSYYGALYGTSGLRPSSEFVEDGSFLKLREVAVRYRLGQGALGRFPGFAAVDGMSLFATARNLHTWSSYRGFDPEVGKSTGNTGSAALGRVDGYQYPNFRTVTLGVELNF